MKATANCHDMFGRWPEQTQRRIERYIAKPTEPRWDDVAHIIIDGWKTVWQAVIEIDSTFPRRGRRTDLAGKIILRWERIPSPHTVLRAIANATRSRE